MKLKITRIVNEKLSHYVKIAMMRKVYSFYFRNEPPALDKVLKRVNDNDKFPSFSKTFLACSEVLNFCYILKERKLI